MLNGELSATTALENFATLSEEERLNEDTRD
jgi:hypothetical protein